MKKLILFVTSYLMLGHALQSQHTGIGTANPQATLHVNGTFKTEHGAIVNGISADSTMTPGSDSLLPTQSAVRRFLKNGKWVQHEGETDSVYLMTSQSEPMNSIQKVVEQNGFAYVLTYYGLWIFDISDPDTMIQRDSTNALFGSGIAGSNCDLEVQGDFAYITSYVKGFLAVYDVSNPDSIVLRSRNPDGGQAFRSLVVDGSYAYAVTYNWTNTTTIVYDISDPDTVVHKLTYEASWINEVTIIEKTGRWIWLIAPYSQFTGNNTYWHRLDALDPDTLIYRHSNGLGGYTVGTTTVGNRIYFAQNGNPEQSYVMFLQVSQTSNQLTTGEISFTPVPKAIHARGNELYVSVAGSFQQTGHYTSVINFDISTGNAKPKWVYESDLNCVHAISHTRFLGASDKVYDISLFPQQYKRDLIRHTDGTLGYAISPWYTDSLFNVTADNGYIGIGTDDPRAKLHLIGDQYIDSTYTIELGADLPDKGLHAGVIGNGTLSGDALDIVGAGPAGHRRIDLYGESAVDMTGKLEVQQLAYHQGTVVAENGFHFSGQVGIATPGSAEQALLVKDGIAIFSDDADLPGIWINRPGNVSTQANFIGDRGDQHGGIKTTAGWNIIKNSTGQYGLGMEPTTDLLSVGGSCKTNLMHLNNNALFQGGVRFSGQHVLQFFHQGPYGTMTYGTTALDIAPANTYYQTKIIHLEAAGGTTIDGPVQVATMLNPGSITTQPWTDLGPGLQNGWVNYGDGFATISMYKDLKGVVHLRGLIKNGLNQQNTVIVNLPAGYRPVHGHQIYAVPNGVNTAGRIDVETDGDVVFRGSTNTFISLDQISFKTN